MKKMLFIALLLMSTSIVFAQDEGEIVGKISDSTSSLAILSAAVSLERDGNIVDQYMTDDNGGFYFKLIKPGKYELKVSYVGKISMFDNIVVRSSAMTFLDLKINMENVLPTLTIVPDDIIISEEVGRRITAEDIGQLGADNVQSIVVSTTPGVYGKDNGDKGGIYIAGSRADATLYIIDGVRVEGSTYVPKNAIAEIIVYTGGIPAKYGDVTGGIIEITTKSFDFY